MREDTVRKIRRLLPALAISCTGLALTGCFSDEETTEEKYAEWRERNTQYVAEAMEKKNEDGTPYYEKIVPDWAPAAYVLIHWHNDRALTEKNLSPMDNSTVKMTYELFDIDGNKISDSFSNTDSVYTSRPLQNIVGMWAAMTTMHVGDTATLVMPSQAAYGEMSNGAVLPYSTLVYNVKMKAITAYEIP